MYQYECQMCEPTGSGKSPLYSKRCNACGGTGWIKESEFKNADEKKNAEDGFKRGMINRKECFDE